MDQLPRLGKKELICLLLFTCNYVVSVWRGFLFLWVLGMGYVILFWHSLSLHIIILEIFNVIITKKGLSQRIPFRRNELPFLPWLILHISFSNSNAQSHHGKFPMHNNRFLCLYKYENSHIANASVSCRMSPWEISYISPTHTGTVFLHI